MTDVEENGEKLQKDFLNFLHVMGDGQLKNILMNSHKLDQKK